ncbi:ABC transporter ATP-binding protein [Natrarchaeobius chitinivorans]|uniref:ABC-type D-xylose/L-arabinose transporter n=1 Tax=Natrarchaeobius chitinivorans TaxID=1679083 RepID=A0A3N6PDZ3_NATCH|nr:ABC transporter ATP-binding protein [Natrarchaeobius chitinivorans]RQG95355.1 ABC transporter ATP-binding protein [Natrarchaeobius chitinivorans]
MSNKNTEYGVELRNVTKRFGDLTAVDDIDLAVRDGEFLVLLGPSGCGKTTTLRMIAGLEVPTDGTIEMHGSDVTEKLPQKRDLSMVFQNYALYPHKTVEDNLRFPLGKMDITEEEATEKVEYATELLGIEDLLDKKPGQLSGGQRQRVALGRTIVREPNLFLMDEPLSNLDAKLRVNTRSELKDLQQQLGTTTVYVTHDQEEAMSIADRIVIMDDGQIQQIGTPQEVYKNPANEFVASFLGEPGMNFVQTAASSNGSVHAQITEPVDLEVSVEGDVPHSKVGVRPQDVWVGPGNSPGAPRDNGYVEISKMRLETIDPLGHSYELRLERGDHSIIALSDDVPGQVGDEVDVAFNRSSIHVFGENTEALSVKP